MDNIMPTRKQNQQQKYNNKNGIALRIYFLLLLESCREKAFPIRRRAHVRPV